MADPSTDLDDDSRPRDEPDALGTSETDALTRARRRELREQRRDAKKAHQERVAAAGTDDEITFVYEPHVRYVPPLRPYLHDLWERRSFAVALAKSKVKGARANTALGSVWSLIDPLFMAALYYFLFTVLRGGTRASSFIPIIISGILHFQVSSAALTEGGNSVSGASNLMLNSTFPRMLLPFSAIYGGVLKFLPSVPIILGAVFLLDGVISLELLWWFVLFPLQVAIGLGLALMVSTAIVFFKDIRNLLNYASRILLFTSPIIYPVDALSDELRSVLQWTPLFGVFGGYQHLVTGLRPDATELVISLGWAVGSILIGGWMFLRYEREFATRL